MSCANLLVDGLFLASLQLYYYSLYFLMVDLLGTQKDIQLVKKKILHPSSNFFLFNHIFLELLGVLLVQPSWNCLWLVVLVQSIPSVSVFRRD